MRCPKCGCEESKVVDSRPSESNDAIRRRRECTRCGFRFTTYERCEETPLLVVKKDGHKETSTRSTHSSTASSPSFETWAAWRFLPRTSAAWCSSG